MRSHVVSVARDDLNRPPLQVQRNTINESASPLTGRNRLTLLHSARFSDSPGGGVFKNAALRVLRRERRLMSTGDVTRWDQYITVCACSVGVPVTCTPSPFPYPFRRCTLHVAASTLKREIACRRLGVASAGGHHQPSRLCEVAHAVLVFFFLRK